MGMSGARDSRERWLDAAAEELRKRIR